MVAQCLFVVSEALLLHGEDLAVVSESACWLRARETQSEQTTERDSKVRHAGWVMDDRYGWGWED